MGRNLRYFKHVIRKTGHTIKKKTSGFINSFFHQDKSYKTHTNTYERRAGVAGREPGATLNVKAARPRDVEPVAQQPKRRGGAFSMRRLPILVAAVAAAVLVPVIVVSANASTNNSLPMFTKQTSVTQPGAPQDDSITANGTIMAASEQGEQAEPQAAQAQAASAEAPQEQTQQAQPEAAAPEADIQEVQAQPQPTPEPKQYLSVTPDQESEDVAKLQQRLMDLNYMEIDEPTNLYGLQTQLGVSYFQRKNGLAMDGVAGEATQDLLFSEDAKPYSVTMEAEGPDVENIQGRLEELGYPVGVTGYFGTETEDAVKYFQRMNGLTDDGSVGQYTKELLFSKSAEPSLEYMEEKEAEEESGSSDKKESSDGDGGGGGTSHTADPGNAQAFVDAAVAQEGKTYVLGGKGPDVFDCSGLVYYALNASGNSVGYMTSGGWANSDYATVGSIGDLQVGDVICFTGHVGVYMGNGTMVDASSSNGKVVIRGLGSWAHRNFICGKRPL